MKAYAISISNPYSNHRRILNEGADMICTIGNMIRRTKRVMELKHEDKVLISDEILPEDKFKIVDLPTDIKYQVVDNGLTKVSNHGAYKLALL